jgi:hypothetical protein
MIIDAITGLIYAIIQPVLWALPFVDDLLNIILLVLTFEITVLGFWIFNWVLNKLRGSG